MIPAFRPLMALLLVAGATLAHAANDMFTAQSATIDVFGVSADTVAAGATPPVQIGAARDFVRAGGWSVGISSARLDRTLIDNGLAAVRTHVGYSRAFGAVDFDATLSYYSYPGARRALTGAGYDYAELSAGLRYGPLSARYNTTLSHDFVGVPGARGSSYLDVGMRRDLGHAMSVMVHAGDGRVAGSGFDWRDLKAGLNRKLEGGWLLALNYTRAYGAAGPYDRMAAAGARADDRPAFLSAGRRALVLSATRRF